MTILLTDTFLALGCAALRIAYPTNKFLPAVLMCIFAICPLLLLPGTLVGRITTRGGSRRDGDVAMAVTPSGNSCRYSIEE